MAIFLTLRDSRRSVAASLAPLSQFLGSYIDLLNQWLYLDNFHIVMENLWIFIVQVHKRLLIFTLRWQVLEDIDLAVFILY